MSKKRANVLVVDDHLENLNVLISYLEDLGFIITVALNAQEAFDVVKKALPDIILLDVLLPDMNGFEACSHLKEIVGREIPVIFMTALTDTIDKLKGFAAGSVDYVTKPIQIEEVGARVGAHLTIYQQRQKLKNQNNELIKQQLLLKKQNDQLTKVNLPHL